MKNYPEYDPLLFIPMFVLDFLCIHPFDDGNGRLSRLLTLLLLYRAGYMIGMYISIEKLIEQTKMNYYEALEASSLGWYEGENDYLPFVEDSITDHSAYLLGRTHIPPSSTKRPSIMCRRRSHGVRNWDRGRTRA